MSAHGIGGTARGRLWPAPAAILLAAVALQAAQAQERRSGIGERIETVFDLVTDNPVDLAIPLTRRALAQRAAVYDGLSAKGETVSVVPMNEALDLAVPGEDQAAGNPIEAVSGDGDPEVVEEIAEIDPAAEVEEGSAEGDASSDEDAARLPRPRPSDPGGPQDTGIADAAPEPDEGAPLDLVAGAAGARMDAATEPQQLVDLSPGPEPIVTAALNSDSYRRAVDNGTGTTAADVVAAPISTPPATAAADLPARADCLALEKVADKDGDFGRNADALKAPGICVTQTKFKERRRAWTIQTVESGRPGPLWAVVHDDEDASFDNAVKALRDHGGKLIAVDTGGKRNQDGIDPNRNFSGEGIGCPKLGDDAAPKFVAAFKQAIDPAQPIIALHNNFDGKVPTTGLGHISMSTVPKKMRAAKSRESEGPLSGEHALVLLAAMDDDQSAADERMRELSGRGINVVLETVRMGKGDCSLSNYAALSGHADYLNVTVHHDEAKKQRAILDALLPGAATVAAAP